MSRRRGFWAAVLASAFLAALAVGVIPLGATALTPEQLKCEQATAKSQAKFWGAKTKCVSKCMDALAKGKLTGGPSVCDPNGGTATNLSTCIGQATGKAEGGEIKKCGPGSCPACYGAANGDPNNPNSGDCALDAPIRTTGEGSITGSVPTELLVDPLFGPEGGAVYCDGRALDAGEPTQKDILKCNDTVAKNGGKLVKALGKCDSKCWANAAKGSTDGPCVRESLGNDPNTSDSTTAECRTNAIAKAAAAINKKCPPGVVECDPNNPAFNGSFIGTAAYNNPSPTLDVGTQWANIVSGFFYSPTYKVTWCSPSGAFL